MLARNRAVLVQADPLLETYRGRLLEPTKAMIMVILMIVMMVIRMMLMAEMEVRIWTICCAPL